MWQYLSKSILLLTLAVALCCGLYPLTLWSIGQLVFPSQANGSLIVGDNGKVVGSRLIAQPFIRDEYFHPRPSAASYNAAASASSSLAASNYALRDRVARTLGSIASYADGLKFGQQVAPDVEQWFAEDYYQKQPHIVAQWAIQHPSLAQGWVKAEPTHSTYVENWAKQHAHVVDQFVKDNPAMPKPSTVDLAVVFFQNFSDERPGKFPGSVMQIKDDGLPAMSIMPINTGPDIQSIFFDMWREDHPDASLQNLPGDLVTTSASGLDPHITLDNAQYQLNRVASKWALDLKSDQASVRQEIEAILQANSSAPFGGLAGEKLINVLEVNLELRKRFGD